GWWETKHHEEWSPEVVNANGRMYVSEDYQSNYNQPLGLWISTAGGPGPVAAGAHAAWVYTVPRYFTDHDEYGTYPESYISHMSLWDLTQMAYSSKGPNPYMDLGLMRPNGTWAANTTHTSEAEHNLTELGHHYEYNGDQESKIGSVGIWAREAYDPFYAGTTVFVQAARLELSEPST